MIFCDVLLHHKYLMHVDDLLFHILYFFSIDILGVRYQFNINLSLSTLAIIDAAAIDSEILSPLLYFQRGIVKFGLKFPSTSI